MILYHVINYGFIFRILFATKIFDCTSGCAERTVPPLVFGVKFAVTYFGNIFNCLILVIIFASRVHCVRNIYPYILTEAKNTEH